MNVIDDLQRRFQSESFLSRSEMERFTTPFHFVEHFSPLYPEQAVDWAQLLVQSGRIMAQLLRVCTLNALRGAVRRTEQLLAPVGKFAKRHIIHCIGHTHIDMNWMWPGLSRLMRWKDRTKNCRNRPSFRIQSL